MTKNDMLRVTRLARVLHMACTLVLIAIPVIAIVAWGIGELGVEKLREDYADYLLPEVIPLGTLVAIHAMNGAGILLTVYVIWQMRILFGFYKAGETLTARCATPILRIGQGLVAIGAIGFLANTISVLLLTMGNPPGSRTLVITFSDGDLGFMMTGGLILVIGWVMREASRIAEDNRGFV